MGKNSRGPVEREPKLVMGTVNDGLTALVYFNNIPHWTLDLVIIQIPNKTQSQIVGYEPGRSKWCQRKIPVDTSLCLSKIQIACKTPQPFVLPPCALTPAVHAKILYGLDWSGECEIHPLDRCSIYYQFGETKQGNLPPTDPPKKKRNSI